jgi:sugar lactone lactonase YvrE
MKQTWRLPGHPLAFAWVLLLFAGGLARGQSAPVITQDLTNQVVPVGSNAILSVAVSGTGPFTYQWQFSGTNLPSGVPSVFAGNHTLVFSGDGGPATNAGVTLPMGLAADNMGNLYFADSAEARIRRVSANGIITTVAGNGTNGFSGDGGMATNASLHDPSGVAVDAFGNLFIADRLNDRIREVSTNGIITTVAGSSARLLGDGGAATNAELYSPAGVTVDSLGNLFIADTVNCRIREVDTNGIITTVAGTTSPGSGFPFDPGLDPYYGGDGGPATSAKLYYPAAVAVDSMGNIYIADTDNQRIREVGTDGIINTIAGNGDSGYSGDGGAATNAKLDDPCGIALDASGNVYIADEENFRIRLLTTNGIISTIAGPIREGGGYVCSTMGTTMDPYGDLFISLSGAIYSMVDRQIVQGPLYRACNMSAANSGKYDVIVAGPYGSVTSAVVTVTAAFLPSASIQPASQFVAVGSNALFTAAAAGPGPYFYQWQFDGTNLDGAMDSSLLLTNVSTNDTGSYAVVVSNNYGGVTSAAVMLTVGWPPAISTQPAGQTALLSGSASLNVAVSGSGPFTYQWQFDGSNVFNSVIITAVGQDQGGAATNTALEYPCALAMDAAGNLFIADEYNNRVCKVGTNGILTSVAGQTTFGGYGSYSGDGGAATNAGLDLPVAVAVDRLGNLYIADLLDDRVRVVNTNGMISTFAGNGVYGYSGDGGPATNAEMTGPAGLAVDNAGDLFIADNGTNCIREVDSNGIIRTVAGTCANGFSGDGGPATNAMMSYPAGLALDASGDLYIADQGNSRIRMVAPNGIITTVAGNGGATYSGDGGFATNASLYNPMAVAVDGNGNLFIADGNNSVIREVTTNGIISTIAGQGGVFGYSGDGGLATSAKLYGPQGVVVDSLGNVFIADTDNDRVRQTQVGGRITTSAGGGIGDGGAGPNASVVDSLSIALDSSGNLFFCDWGHERIRVMRTNGLVSTVAGNGSAGYTGNGGPATNATMDEPIAVTVDPAGNVYFVDYGNGVIRQVATNGVIATVAGGGTNTSANGIAATNAALAYPRGLATDAFGNLFFSDTSSNRIRVVSAAGIVTTVAGTGAAAFSGDGGPATNATFNYPWGMALDGSGNLFVADFGNCRIREIAVNGTVTTVAGNGTTNFLGDGGPATSAALDHPYAVAVDGFGNLFIGDGMHYRVRKVSSAGTITTVAGDGTQGFAGDGGPPLQAKLNIPIGVAVNAAGAVFIADFLNFRIREVLFPTPTLQIPNMTGASAGSYDVVVTSLFGSVTSSVATLNVALPPMSAAWCPGQGVQFQFTGSPASQYVLLMATNLTPPVIWQPLCTNAADAAGNCCFSDTNTGNPAQYYRAAAQ